jgi:hypothetical protein
MSMCPDLAGYERTVDVDALKLLSAVRTRRYLRGLLRVSFLATGQVPVGVPT